MALPIVIVWQRIYDVLRGRVDLRSETFTLSALSDEDPTDWVKSDLLETLATLRLCGNGQYPTDWVKSDLLETGKARLPLETMLSPYRSGQIGLIGNTPIANPSTWVKPLPIGLNRTYWKQVAIVHLNHSLNTLPTGLNRTYWKPYQGTDTECLL